MAVYRIQVRRDTLANWATVNPTLAQGEIGFETDTGKIKIGDGASNWNTLLYFSAASIATLTVAGGGTGQVTAQAGINALTAVSSATNEYVLTKDTATGNAIFKISSGGYWTESSNVDYLTTTANKIAIGRTSLISTEKVVVDGSADIIQMIVRGNATQTANVFEVRKSDNTVLFGVTNTAGITVSGASAVITPSSGNLNLTDTTDATKIIAIQVSGATTGKTLTLAGVQTNNITLTLPNATDTLVAKATTDTLTNKRVTKRVTSTNAPGATPTFNTDNCDVLHLTGLAVAITSMTTNLSGTPVQGDTLRIDFTDDGTGRAITWGASFEASGNTALPTTTVSNVRLDVAFVWNTVTSHWRCVGVS